MMISVRRMNDLLGRNNTLAAENERLRTALKMLYDETEDYIRLNNLGGLYNQCMQLARAALGPEAYPRIIE